MTKPLTISEASIESACSDLLALDGWRSLKTDPVSRREWGKGFGEKGMADRLYIRYEQAGRTRCFSTGLPLSHRDKSEAQLMWIEWKSPRGTAKPHQRMWHEAERARGALTLIAGIDFPRSVDGFMDWYLKSGLARSHGIKAYKPRGEEEYRR